MGFKIVKTKDKNFKSANAEKNIISIGSCRWANIFINQAALESSLLVNIANKDSVFSDDQTLDRIFLSLKSQFANFDYDKKEFAFVRTEQQIDKIVNECVELENSIILYTIVESKLAKYISKQSEKNILYWNS